MESFSYGYCITPAMHSFLRMVLTWLSLLERGSYEADRLAQPAFLPAAIAALALAAPRCSGSV